MKMKKGIVLILALAMALGMLAGCGSKSSSAALQREMTEETAAAGIYNAKEAPMEAMMYDGADLAAGQTAASEPAISLPENRKWIITMSLSAETSDLDAALAAVNAQIHAAGGYVEGQSISNSTAYRRSRNAFLTIRIPADRVDSFANEVSGIANVVSNSRNVQDITLTYADTEGRVNALKTEEQRLLELMEKAETMSDLLEIEARLTEVRYQLESRASQLRLYDNQIDYATVDLYISEVEKYTPVEEPGFWKRITDGLSESITNLGKDIVNLIAWIIVELPYLIIWALVICVAIVVTKRCLRKRKAKKSEKKQEPKA